MDTSIAAEIVGSNHDLLLQILMRLPVKSLMCFKSVSNDWLLIITDEVCARRDYVVSPTPDPSLGIFMRVKVGKYEASADDYRYEYIPLSPNHRFSNKSPVLRDFFTRPRPFRGDIILSSNGLLLFYDFDSHRYIVYNPTKLSYTIIPNPTTEKTGDRWNNVGVTMAFDRVTSHYKLIFISPISPIRNTYNSCKIDIYSSETHAWKDSCIIKEGDGGSPEMLRNGVYWNGSVHWIVSDSYGGSGKILAFHIDTLALHEVTEPTMSTRNKYNGHNSYFGESCGYLHYIEKEANDLSMIYEMKTDYSKWLPKYRINFAKISNWLNVLALIRFEDEKESPVLILWVRNKVVKCNLTTRKFKTLREFPNEYGPGQRYVQKYVARTEGREKGVAISPSFRTEGAFPFIPSFSST